MNRLILIVSLTLLTNMTFAYRQDNSSGDLSQQKKSSSHPISKPPIDHSVYGRWPEVGNAKISNNGGYAMYTIHNMPSGNNTLVIQSINKPKKKELAGIANGDFTQDSKKVIFKTPGDSLCLLEIETGIQHYIPYVTSYQLTREPDIECLIYRLSTPMNGLIVRNLHSGKEQLFDNVRDYLLSDNGKVLLLETKENDSTIIHWVNLPEGNMTTIWQGEKAGNYVFDATETQLVFIAEKTENNQTAYSLWRYKIDMKEAKEWVNNHTIGIECGLAVSNFLTPRFSKDGTKLFFNLREISGPIAKSNEVKVDIWHYKDERLQSEQLTNPKYREFAAVINVGGERVIRLTREGERMALNGGDVSEKNDYILMWRQISNNSETNWRISAKPVLYLVSTKDGTRTIVKAHSVYPDGAKISSGGKYVIYFDREKKHYFSYNIENGRAINITQDISSPLFDEDDDSPASINPVMSLAGWLPNDEAVFIYDLYDIWQVDPSGIKPPVNITSGYGRMHHIVFRFLTDDCALIPEDEKVLLSAFNRINKQNGFYSHRLGLKSAPRPLTMGSFVINLPPVSFSSYIGKSFLPIKARHADVYIVKRESAIESPNYYYTRDFKTYSKLSDIDPQRKYNWMTAELIRWRTFDGSMSEGILYKPEDFDSTKKYPVILCFYEKLTDGLNLFLKPEVSGGAMRIPWYVSNGYLVCTPDIHYTIGKPGESAYNSVVSAARYLAKMSWIDSSKIGIQGHSFGGYEVNYLITHTNIFAAAAEAAGICNFISGYGSLQGNSKSRQGLYEKGQSRMGLTLWQVPELYIENSPVFKADKVQTPLLIMHNKNDDSVPFAQGIEWFTALRRLGKRVWMLQYDGQGHQVGGRAGEDYTVRLAQFFDHYLKNAPAPKWLTTGVPAREKGINTGLELDEKGERP